MAKHTIDLLTLLRQKTKSNLTSEEDKLLESLLYDLRLRYVEAVKAGRRVTLQVLTSIRFRNPLPSTADGRGLGA